MYDYTTRPEPSPSLRSSPHPDQFPRGRGQQHQHSHAVFPSSMQRRRGARTRSCWWRRPRARKTRTFAVRLCGRNDGGAEVAFGRAQGPVDPTNRTTTLQTGACRAHVTYDYHGGWQPKTRLVVLRSCKGEKKRDGKRVLSHARTELEAKRSAHHQGVEVAPLAHLARDDVIRSSLQVTCPESSFAKSRR